MTEQITLSASPEQYERCFPNPLFSPPSGSRSSEPGDIVQAVYMIDGEFLAKDAEWGYIPPKRTFAGTPITYAEGATITRKHTTSSAFCNWRCVVPASNFTFLREVDGQMMRYKLSRRDRGLMHLAGILEPNPPRIGGPGGTVALITTPSNRKMQPYVWERPLMLEHGQVEQWVHPRTSIAEVKGFIQPPADTALKLTVRLESAAELALV